MTDRNTDSSEYNPLDTFESFLHIFEAPRDNSVFALNHIQSSATGLNYNKCRGQALFYRCNLRNVIFYKVHLKNVCFVNLDLENVRFTHLSMKNCFWPGAQAKNMLISHTSFRKMKVWTEGQMNRVEASSKSVLIRDTEYDRDESSLRRLRTFYGDCGPDMELYSIKSANLPSLLKLQGYPEVLQLLMEYVIPPEEPAYVHEYDRGDPRVSKVTGWTKRPSIRVRHRTTGVKFGLPSTDSYETTYFVSTRPDRRYGQTNNATTSVVQSSLGLLWCSKNVRNMVVPYLYDRPFHMQCSPRAAIEFLHAHWPSQPVWNSKYKPMAKFTSARPVKHLTLYFETLDVVNHEWHTLMGCLRHEYSSLDTVLLHVGIFFWTAVDWKQGAEHLVKQSKAWKEKNEQKRWAIERAKKAQPHHFLREFAKIAAPAKRYCEDDSSEVSKEGTRAGVIFDGVDSEEKRKFVKALNESVRRVGTERPWFDRKRRKYLREPME